MIPEIKHSVKVFVKDLYFYTLSYEEPLNDFKH